MGFDKLFWLAFQSSFLLGLIHGVNPCGHSWLMLAPFAVSTREGRKVAWLTTAFSASPSAPFLGSSRPIFPGG